MDRLPTSYNLLEGLKYISSDDLISIEKNAALLSLEETYEMLFIEPDHLSEDELLYCRKAHRRGKKMAIANACDVLFQRMRDRNGTSACIEFLQNCGKFSIDAKADPTHATKSSGFSFNVFMDGEAATQPSIPNSNQKVVAPEKTEEAA